MGPFQDLGLGLILSTQFAERTRDIGLMISFGEAHLNIPRKRLGCILMHIRDESSTSITLSRKSCRATAANSSAIVIPLNGEKSIKHRESLRTRD